MEGWGLGEITCEFLSQGISCKVVTQKDDLTSWVVIVTSRFLEMGRIEIDFCSSDSSDWGKLVLKCHKVWNNFLLTNLNHSLDTRIRLDQFLVLRFSFFVVQKYYHVTYVFLPHISNLDVLSGLDPTRGYLSYVSEYARWAYAYFSTFFICLISYPKLVSPECFYF